MSCYCVVYCVYLPWVIGTNLHRNLPSLPHHRSVHISNEFSSLIAIVMECSPFLRVHFVQYVYYWISGSLQELHSLPLFISNIHNQHTYTSRTPHTHITHFLFSNTADSPRGLLAVICCQPKIKASSWWLSSGPSSSQTWPSGHPSSPPPASLSSPPAILGAGKRKGRGGYGRRWSELPGLWAIEWPPQLIAATLRGRDLCGLVSYCKPLHSASLVLRMPGSREAFSLPCPVSLEQLTTKSCTYIFVHVIYPKSYIPTRPHSSFNALIVRQKTVH